MTTDLHLLAKDQAALHPGATGSHARVQVLLYLSQFRAGLTGRELVTYVGLPEPDVKAALRGLQLCGRVECIGRGIGSTWRVIVKGEA